jgi:uncharacterized protein
MKKNLVVNVSELSDGEKRLSLKLAPDPEYPIEGDMKIDLTLSRIGEKVSIRGTAQFVQKLQCSRCLADIRKPKREPIKAVYTPLTRLETELELTNADVNTLFYEGDLIDLKQPITDVIMLAVPMRPLCTPDCKGLCPKCGKNLNDDECDCRRREIDPRWKPLGKLLH